MKKKIVLEKCSEKCPHCEYQHNMETMLFEFYCHHPELPKRTRIIQGMYDIRKFPPVCPLPDNDVPLSMHCRRPSKGNVNEISAFDRLIIDIPNLMSLNMINTFQETYSKKAADFTLQQQEDILCAFGSRRSELEREYQNKGDQDD